MDSVLRYWSIDPQDWSDFWHALVKPKQAWIWAEDAATWHFSTIEEYTELPGLRGRLFAEQGELRWRQIEQDRLALVFLGTQLWDGLDKMHDASDNLHSLVPQPIQHILWGEWESRLEAWVEQRIPHHFKYPTTGSRVMLTGYQLVDPVTYAVQFQRYAAVKPWSEEGLDASRE